MNNREIEKNPEVPVLSDKAIKLLTELCFKKADELSPADVLFVFGTSYGISDIASAAENILLRGLVPSVIAAGGAPMFPDTPKMSRSEAIEILHALKIERFPMTVFRSESDSHNTQDNVRLSLKFPELAKASKVIYLFRSHACGRGFLTLKRYLPNAKLLALPVDVSYQKGAPPVSRDAWPAHLTSRGRVWGEFLRIERYGSRGDIHYPRETQDMVEKIKRETTRA